MSEQNLSKWFNLEDWKPWQVGVYETEDDLGGQYFNYWDGNVFHWGMLDKDSAPNDMPMDSSVTIKWRGISTNPEVKKKTANKRKTMYVVMNAISNSPVASFNNVNSARDYAERVNFPVRVRRIRFRTPE